MNDVLYLPSMGQNLMEDSKEVSQTLGQTPVVGGGVLLHYLPGVWLRASHVSLGPSFVSGNDGCAYIVMLLFSDLIHSA